MPEIYSDKFLLCLWNKLAGSRICTSFLFNVSVVELNSPVTENATSLVLRGIVLMKTTTQGNILVSISLVSLFKNKLKTNPFFKKKSNGILKLKI